MSERSPITLVTGGGRGIGRSIALRMARETPILVVGRTPAALESTCAEIRHLGGVAAACVGDIADPETAAATARMVRDHGWVARNLICNAGIGTGGRTESYDPEQWRQTFAVNVHGTFYFVQAFLPSMLEEGRGTICLMSSVAGVKGHKYLAAYTASKHALVGLARSLALEYGKRGIVTVPVCPSFVESDMARRTIRGLMEHQQLSEAEAEARVAAKNPQQRIIPPEEVAEAVAMICAGGIPALNGNPLILSGGE